MTGETEAVPRTEHQHALGHGVQCPGQGIGAETSPTNSKSRPRPFPEPRFCSQPFRRVGCLPGPFPQAPEPSSSRSAAC